ncbi:MAG: leucyl aminopeptidase [Flavobacteriales bacterium]|nr:leucyl aminopeptidase [Flavobacteriales bacterium]
MSAKNKKTSKKETNIPRIIVGTSETKLLESDLGNAFRFVLSEREKNPVLEIPGTPTIYIVTIKEEDTTYKTKEKARQAGSALASILKRRSISSINISNKLKKAEWFLCFIEGLLLGAYAFRKYKTTKENSLFEKFEHDCDFLNEKDLEELLNIVYATEFARDLVNETPQYLDAVTFANEIKEDIIKCGAKAEILGKKQIESLKMGGVLAVNRGSVHPPTFTILEWKPKNAKNKKPVVLVGKGVVYDTGGLDIKTGGSMATMKCDMAGAAAVAGTTLAIAKNKLPVHIVALIPATDNRPSGNAYAAGDVITMHNGKTVEVLNTDAEGRMILADALSYAQKYNPELVIDMATLTGAAVRAIGDIGIVAMGNVDENCMNELKTSGNHVYERIAEMPFWEEYGEMIKSEIADIKNIGGATAGQITAGKFLEHFTKYPWIHLDIAGPAFLDKASHYRPSGGTGVGVRLLYNFIKNKYVTNQTKK